MITDLNGRSAAIACASDEDSERLAGALAELGIETDVYAADASGAVLAIASGRRYDFVLVHCTAKTLSDRVMCETYRLAGDIAARHLVAITSDWSHVESLAPGLGFCAYLRPSADRDEVRRVMEKILADEKRALAKTEHPDLMGKHFLVVDNNVSNVEILKNAIECFGGTVDVSSSGEEAISKMLNAPASGDAAYSMVLMDIYMPPGIDGLEATQRFRNSAHPLAKTLPIVIVSGDADPLITVREREVGASAFHLKPLTRSALVEILRRFLDLPTQAETNVELTRIRRISELKEDNRKLTSFLNTQKAASAFFNHMFDALPQPVFLKDAANSQYLRCNPAFVEANGHTSEQIIGMFDRDIFPAEFAEAFVAHDKATLAAPDGRCFFPTHGCGADGCEHRLWDKWQVVIDGQDGRRYILGALSEVTKRVEDANRILQQERQINEAVKKERDVAVAAEKAKSFFFSAISHDIRTPLNSVIGFVDMLEREDDPALRQEYIRNIKSSGRDLMRLVDDMIDLVKYDNGGAAVLAEPFQVGDLARECRDALKGAVEAKGLEFTLDLPDDMPLLVVDRRHFRQILMNLVDNAVKFTEKGSVKVSLSYVSEVLTLRVKDTGCGIARDDLERILKPYVKVENRTQTGGTGIGLAIVNLLVERMGGKLSVQSLVGVGSEFSVVVPDVKVGKIKAADTGLKASKLLPFDGKRLLLVDDVKLNLMVLSSYCRKLGAAKCLMASCGEEALQVLAKEPVDMVLTDILMPGMGGVGLVKEIRANKDYEKMPVHAVTADVEFAKNGDTRNFDGVIMKPLTLDSLSRHFAKYIS